MNYYIFISKIADIDNPDDAQSAMEELTDVLGFEPENLEEGMRVFFNEALVHILTNNLAQSPVLTLKVLFDENGEVVLQGITLIALGTGQDKEGNTVFITPLGTITVLP